MCPKKEIELVFFSKKRINKEVLIINNFAVAFKILKLAFALEKNMSCVVKNIRTKPNQTNNKTKRSVCLNQTIDNNAGKATDEEEFIFSIK